MNHIIENFKLEDHLEQLEIITEHLDDVDGSTFTTKHKALKLGEHSPMKQAGNISVLADGRLFRNYFKNKRKKA